MKKNGENRLAKFFAEAFREVVLPHLEELKEDMKDVKDRLFKVEEGLIKIDDRLDRHGLALDDHKKRIKRLENKTSAVV